MSSPVISSSSTSIGLSADFLLSGEATDLQLAPFSQATTLQGRSDSLALAKKKLSICRVLAAKVQEARSLLNRERSLEQQILADKENALGLMKLTRNRVVELDSCERFIRAFRQGSVKTSHEKIQLSLSRAQQDIAHSLNSLQLVNTGTSLETIQIIASRMQEALKLYYGQELEKTILQVESLLEVVRKRIDEDLSLVTGIMIDPDENELGSHQSASSMETTSLAIPSELENMIATFEEAVNEQRSSSEDVDFETIRKQALDQAMSLLFSIKRMEAERNSLYEANRQHQAKVEDWKAETKFWQRDESLMIEQLQTHKAGLDEGVCQYEKLQEELLEKREVLSRALEDLERLAQISTAEEAKKWIEEEILPKLKCLEELKLDSALEISQGIKPQNEVREKSDDHSTEKENLEQQGAVIKNSESLAYINKRLGDLTLYSDNQELVAKRVELVSRQMTLAKKSLQELSVRFLDMEELETQLKMTQARSSILEQQNVRKFNELREAYADVSKLGADEKQINMRLGVMQESYGKWLGQLDRIKSYSDSVVSRLNGIVATRPLQEIQKNEAISLAELKLVLSDLNQLRESLPLILSHTLEVNNHDSFHKQPIAVKQEEGPSSKIDDGRNVSFLHDRTLYQLDREYAAITESFSSAVKEKFSTDIQAVDTLETVAAAYQIIDRAASEQSYVIAHRINNLVCQLEEAEPILGSVLQRSDNLREDLSQQRHLDRSLIDQIHRYKIPLERLIKMVEDADKRLNVAEETLKESIECLEEANPSNVIEARDNTVSLLKTCRSAIDRILIKGKKLMPKEELYA